MARRHSVLRILHWNDFYTLDHLAKLSTCLRSEKKALVEGERAALSHQTDLTGIANDAVDESHKKTIVAVAGDFLAPNILTPIDKGRSFLKCINALGVDFLCLGNHEGDLDLKNLRARVRELRCDCQLLNSNVPGFDLDDSRNPKKRKKEEDTENERMASVPGRAAAQLGEKDREEGSQGKDPPAAVRTSSSSAPRSTASPTPRLPEYEIVDVGEYRIGLIGLLSDEPNIFANDTFKGFNIENVVVRSRQLSRTLREDRGCDAGENIYFFSS